METRQASNCHLRAISGRGRLWGAGRLLAFLVVPPPFPRCHFSANGLSNSQLYLSEIGHLLDNNGRSNNYWQKLANSLSQILCKQNAVNTKISRNPFLLEP
jgi:hypothetical protein